MGTDGDTARTCPVCGERLLKKPDDTACCSRCAMAGEIGVLRVAHTMSCDLREDRKSVV